jgi:hypothetical protein
MASTSSTGAGVAEEMPHERRMDRNIGRVFIRCFLLRFDWKGGSFHNGSVFVQQGLQNSAFEDVEAVWR